MLPWNQSPPYNYQHKSLLTQKSYFWAFGAVSKLPAVRSIARDFKKYKPVAWLYDLFNDINRPLKTFYGYRTSRKLASQADVRNKSALYIGCQTCTVESLLAEAMCFPSGDQARLLTAAPDV